VFISPQISKKKNKTAITTRSHALSLKAQGAIKTSQVREVPPLLVDDREPANCERG